MTRSWFLGTGLSFLLLSFVGVCVSYFTPNWIVGVTESGNIWLGLWNSCIDEGCARMAQNHGEIANTLGGWLLGCQILSTLGMVVAAMALGLTASAALCHCFDGRPGVLKLSALLLYGAAVLYGSAALLYGIEGYTRHLVGNTIFFGFSFYAGIGAVFGLTVSAIFLLAEYQETTITMRSKTGYIQLNDAP